MANGPQQTTAEFAKVATGTGLKTLIQFQPSATLPARIVEWGISLDASAAATPGTVELIETDVAATVTAYVAADLTKVDGDAIAAGVLTTNLIQVGTAASGYTASAEGTITAVRNLAGPQLIAPTTQFIQQFPLGNEPIVQVSKFARIRVHFGTTVNAYCYMIVRI
jgi:dUTPase